MIARDEFGLNQRQRKFADIYFLTGNATRSAIGAGYAFKTAKHTASRVLTYVNVSAYLDLRRAEYSEKVGVSYEAKLKFLWEFAQRCAGENGGVFNPMGVVAAIAELNKMQGHYAST